MNDDILDSTLDDLADLPSTTPFPAGAHKVSLTMDLPKPKAGKNQMVVVKLKHISVLELADPTAVHPNAGDESTIFIHIYKKDKTPNEFGQGQLKQILSPLKEAGLQGNTRELIEATKAGVDMDVVVGVRDYNGSDQQELKKISLST